MPWPFAGPFAPMHEGVVDVIEPKGVHRWALHVLDLGVLKVPSGRLLACDPFIRLQDGLVFAIPPGDYSARATVADVSDGQDGSHMREAYLSLVLQEGETATHRVLVPVSRDAPAEGSFHAVGVDAGTVAFVDAAGAGELMPKDQRLYEDVIHDWMAQMDGPPLPEGYANIKLPHAKDGENLVLIHSGWGDGEYPVVGTFGSAGELLGVHIDLQVVGEFTTAEPLGPSPTATALPRIEAAMTAGGLQPFRMAIGGALSLIGSTSEFRWGWFATRLNTFIYVARFESGTSRETLDRYLRDACDKAIHLKGATRGLQSGVAAVTVAVVDRASAEQVEWASKPHGRRFAAITYPVLVEAASGKVTRPERMVLGGAYLGYLKELVKSFVEAPLSH